MVSYLTSVAICIILMLLLHILADFHLQGKLCDLKREEYWKRTCEKEQVDLYQYRNDYKVAMVAHCIEWTIIVMSAPAIISWLHYEIVHPLFWSCFFILMGLNTLFHYQIDDMKANRYKINLLTDQLLHLMQIVLTAILVGVMQWIVG